MELCRFHSRCLLTRGLNRALVFLPCKRDRRMVSPGSGKPFVRSSRPATLPPLFLNGRKYDKAIGFMRPSRQPIETKYVCALDYWIVSTYICMCVCVYNFPAVLYRFQNAPSDLQERM